MKHSIATRLAETGGHPSGFDYMRLFLAISVVCLHSGIVCYGLPADQAIFTSPARPLVRFVLPAFFALSGFLVAGSLERSRTLGMFLGLRILRIYPALTVEMLLSAFLLGPLLTTAPLSHYFSDQRFFLYLRNAVGDVHFHLPGMFAQNPDPDIVNGQLWTVPFELGCYMTLSILALLGVRRQRHLIPVAIVLVTLAYLFITLLHHHWTIMFVPAPVSGALLVVSFLAGVGIYMYRELLPWTPAAGLLAGLLSIACLGFLPYAHLFAPIPAAYATICLGLLNPNRRWLRGADYSYGIFLYGFIIQQTVVATCPFARVWFVNILVSLPLAVLVAAFSWHCVEKPAQKLRFWLKAWEAAYLARRPQPIEDPAQLASAQQRH